MAKHRRHGGRGYGSALTDMNSGVTIKDVYIGGAVSFVGSFVLNGVDFALKKDTDAAGPLTTALGTSAAIVKPLLSGVIAGGLLYLISRKSNPQRAKGHMAGAMAVGIGLAARGAVQAALPSLPKEMAPYVRLDGVPIQINGMPYQLPVYGGPRQLPVHSRMSGVPIALNSGRSMGRYNGNVDMSVP